MKTTINHIGTVKTGIFPKTISEGEILYLQPRHFNEDGQIVSIVHPEIRKDDVRAKDLLREGDILFAAKGSKNFAVLFEGTDQPAVASTSFLVIRLSDNCRDIILPKFLVWFMNLPNTRKLLQNQAEGTSLPSIAKSVISELEIPLPTIQTQYTILNVTRLQAREKELKKRIETLREQQIQYYLLNAIS